MSDKEERIRARAHELWENDGHAHGNHDHHWAQATREIEEEDNGVADDALTADLSILGDANAGAALQSDDAMPPPAPRKSRKSALPKI